MPRVICEKCGTELHHRGLKRHQEREVCQNRQVFLAKPPLEVIVINQQKEIEQLIIELEKFSKEVQEQQLYINQLRKESRYYCPHNLQRRRCRICVPESPHFCKLCRYITASKKYKGYCVLCYVHTFPSDKLSKKAHRKSDELKVKVYLADTIPEFVHNRRIWLGDCSAPYRRFLDFHVMIGNTLVVIEVDENQHKYYSKEDEELRVHEILHNIGLDKKMVFIRFNPSPYKCEGTQVCIDNRLVALVDEAKKVIEYLRSGEEYEAIHHEVKMFYDEC